MQAPIVGAGIGLVLPKAMVACVLAFACALAHARPVEPYSVRPHILDVDPLAHDLLPSWERTKRATVDTVAFLLEVYPDHELCFLARDGELFYDAAVLASAGSPRDRARLHLLNVSTVSKGSPSLARYLRQQGVFRSLREGKKLVFIDTGFSGSIPMFIRNLVPQSQRSQISSHMLVSHNEQIPSLRVYGSAMNPKLVSATPFMLGSGLVPIELRAKYTKPVIGYERIAGVWQPVSDRVTPSDEYVSGDTSVSRARARAYMEDLSAYFRGPENAARLADRRAFVKRLVMLAHEAPKTLAAELREVMKQAGEDPFPESVARDFVDTQRTNRVFGLKRNKLDLKMFGLTDWVEGSATETTIAELAARHSRWAPILRRPKQAITSLAKQGKLDELGAVLAEATSTPYLLEVTTALGALPWTPTLERLAYILLDKNDENLAQAVAISLLSNRAAPRALVQFLMTRFRGTAMNALAAHVFPVPHVEDLTDLTKIFIRRAVHTTALMHFAEHTLSQLDLKDREALVTLTMAHADAGTRSIIEAQQQRTPAKPAQPLPRPRPRASAALAPPRASQPRTVRRGKGT